MARVSKMLTLLSLCLNPRVTVGVLDNLVWHLLDVALHLSIAELATDETLRGEKGVLWIHNGLTLGRNTDQTLAIFGEANNRWRRSRTCNANELLTSSISSEMAGHTLSVFYYARLLAFHHRDSGVGGTQIDTDDMALDLLIGVSLLHCDVNGAL